MLSVRELRWFRGATELGARSCHPQLLRQGLSRNHGIAQLDSLAMARRQVAGGCKLSAVPYPPGVVLYGSHDIFFESESVSSNRVPSELALAEPMKKRLFGGGQRGTR